MTLDEIKACDKPTLTPADVASAIGADAQGIRIMAHECPEKLGFPFLRAMWVKHKDYAVVYGRLCFGW